MTRNKKVAEKMGWQCENDVMFSGSQTFYPSISICDAKLLQARMRQDGWKIIIEVQKDGSFFIHAFHIVGKKAKMEYVFHPNSESAALFDLFCRVYGIADEN